MKQDTPDNCARCLKRGKQVPLSSHLFYNYDHPTGRQTKVLRFCHICEGREI